PTCIELMPEAGTLGEPFALRAPLATCCLALFRHEARLIPDQFVICHMHDIAWLNTEFFEPGRNAGRFEDALVPVGRFLVGEVGHLRHPLDLRSAYFEVMTRKLLRLPVILVRALDRVDP